jgi:MFS transporter, OFA family, oxalate/formate antiporter
MAIGASLAGFLSITTAIVNWFDRKRSMAMGIALLGTAVGGLLLPLVVRGLEVWGWRTVANLSALAVLRRRPQEYGLLPDGATLEVDSHGVSSADTAPDLTPSFTAREAMRTRAFWFISLAHAASVLVVSVVTVHFTPHATGNLGYSLQAAAGLVTIQTITNLIGRPFGGWLSDRIGSRAVIILCMLLHAVALVLLAFAQALWMIAAFALLNGLAWGARVPVIVSIRAEYFGAKSFGSIMGISSSVVTVAAVIAPVLAAMSYDAFGSYTLSFVTLAAFAALGSLFMVFMPPPAPRPVGDSPLRPIRARPTRA